MTRKATRAKKRFVVCDFNYPYMPLGIWDTAEGITVVCVQGSPYFTRAQVQRICDELNRREKTK